MVGEYKEGNVVLEVEVHDAGEDGEGRIVHHHIALLIGIVLEIATGVEGAHDTAIF